MLWVEIKQKRKQGMLERCHYSQVIREGVSENVTLEPRVGVGERMNHVTQSGGKEAIEALRKGCI